MATKKRARRDMSGLSQFVDPAFIRAAGAHRNDNLENTFLGYGTGRDKLSYGMFVNGARLSDQELDAMYYSDDISAKIVNMRPEEMLRRGYRIGVRVGDKLESTPATVALSEKAKALDLNKKVLRSMQWGRLRGGSLLVLGALDGSVDLSKPLNIKAVEKVLYANVVDRRYATVVRWQESPLAPNYGDAEVYQIGTTVGGVGLARVHHTRVIRFDGVEETDPVKRRELGGWTHSALQRPYDIIRKFATSYDSVSHLMADASQGVWKIDGLMDLITSDPDVLRQRLAFSDMTRSSGRAIMVDTEGEDFTRITTSFNGVDQIIDRMMMRLSASSGTPVAVFFGRSAAGMNATGDADFRAWYGELSTDQVNELKPKFIRAYEVISGGALPENFDLEFNPLWEPTAKEKAETEKIEAETEKTKAETHQVYVDMGAYTPEAVALAEFGEGGDGCIEIDEAALRKALSNEIELRMGGEGEEMAKDTGAGATATGGEGADGLNGSKVVLAPTDAASVVTVNEARKAMGLGELKTSEGATDKDGFLTVAEFKAKREAAVATEAAKENPPPVVPGPGGSFPPGGPKGAPPSGDKLPPPVAPAKGADETKPPPPANDEKPNGE